MLHEWLKNIIRLFSAYLNKETCEKLLCHAWKFYLGVSSILLITSHVMCILCYLERIKARGKANSKEIKCDIDLTKSLDSVDSSQRNKCLLIQKQILAYLTIKQLWMLERVGWRSPEVISKSIALMNGIILGSMHQSSVKQVLYEGLKRHFQLLYFF